jgi:dCMP deaminase
MDNLMEQLNWLQTPFAVSTRSDDGHFLRLAYTHGNAMSPDPRTKNGAILVGSNNKIITYSTNKFPIGVKETISRLDNRSIKLQTIIHAENGAIFNAARHGKSTNNAILYCPFYACSECAKAIIEAGIRRVVGHAQLMAIASSHNTWVESIRYAWKMMYEAGIECVLYNGMIGLMTKFNDKDIAV